MSVSRSAPASFAAERHPPKQRTVGDPAKLQPDLERQNRAAQFAAAAADLDLAPAGLAAHPDDDALLQHLDPAGAVRGLIRPAVEARYFGATQAAGEAEQQDGAIAQAAQVVFERGEHGQQVVGEHRIFLLRGPAVLAADALHDFGDMAIGAVERRPVLSTHPAQRREPAFNGPDRGRFLIGASPRGGTGGQIEPDHLWGRGQGLQILALAPGGVMAPVGRVSPLGGRRLGAASIVARRFRQRFQVSRHRRSNDRGEGRGRRWRGGGVGGHCKGSAGDRYKSDNLTLSDILIPDKPGAFSVSNRQKRRSVLGSDMLRNPEVPTAQQVFLSLRVSLPHWARHDPSLPDLAEAALRLGATLAALDLRVRGAAPIAGVWRQRLALRAAAASVRMVRRGEDEAMLRDAVLLAPTGADPGPAGRLLLAWRALDCSSPLADDVASRVAETLQLGSEARLRTAIAAAQELAASKQGAPFAAAATMSAVLAVRPDAEIFALWLADAVLAARLHWPRPLPLLASALQHPSLRRDGRRPHPGDPNWMLSCCLAYARAAAEARDLFAELGPKSEKLLTLAPRLRAKGAAAVIDALHNQDAVLPSARLAGMSDRGLRRLFDRLVTLGAVRELTGRTTFRLYGL